MSLLIRCFRTLVMVIYINLHYARRYILVFMATLICSRNIQSSQKGNMYGYQLLINHMLLSQLPCKLPHKGQITKPVTVRFHAGDILKGPMCPESIIIY